jgi:hypothetical protein
MNLVELFKTPAFAALVAAGGTLAGAILTALVTPWINRRSAHTQWLRERRSHSYEILITSLDRLANAELRAAHNPNAEKIGAFKAASEEFSRARSITSLYAPASIVESLMAATLTVVTETFQDGDPTQWFNKAVMALAVARQQIIEVTRKDLQSDR